MARNDYLVEKTDSNDIKEYDNLINSAMQAKRQIEKGFINLA